MNPSSLISFSSTASSARWTAPIRRPTPWRSRMAALSPSARDGEIMKLARSSRTPVIDLNGRRAIPGLIDAATCTSFAVA